MVDHGIQCECVGVITGNVRVKQQKDSDCFYVSFAIDTSEPSSPRVRAKMFDVSKEDADALSSKYHCGDLVRVIGNPRAEAFTNAQGFIRSTITILPSKIEMLKEGYASGRTLEF